MPCTSSKSSASFAPSAAAVFSAPVSLWSWAAFRFRMSFLWILHVARRSSSSAVVSLASSRSWSTLERASSSLPTCSSVNSVSTPVEVDVIWCLWASP
uniref:Putative secreted protein n=1 Tax=Ixodes ricinus TaxID=34613 RepID=A0A6B0UDX4_IXORI